MDASQIGKRAWSYAGVLRDAGSPASSMSATDVLLFLKMADQLTEPPHNKAPIIHRNWAGRLCCTRWRGLGKKYHEILATLGRKPGMLGVIFKGARCEIHNPALLAGLPQVHDRGISMVAGRRKGGSDTGSGDKRL